MSLEAGRERIAPADQELEQAQKSLDWLREVFINPESEQGKLNALARQRIMQLTGKQRLYKHDVQRIAGAFWEATTQLQPGIAYYTSGFPDEVVEFYGDVSVVDIAEYLGGFFKKKDRVAKKTMGKAAADVTEEFPDEDPWLEPEADVYNDGKAAHDEDDEVSAVLEEVRLSDDAVKDYLRDVGKTKLLTALEEVELQKRIEAGLYAEKLVSGDVQSMRLEMDDEALANLEQVIADGEAAKKSFTQANLRLVVSLAKKYQGRGLSLPDLIQEGNFGLIRAVEKFDYTRGYKFSTYATWWVKQSITRGLADTSRMIRMPAYSVDRLNRINRIIRELEAREGGSLEDNEMIALSDGSITYDDMLFYDKYGRKGEPLRLSRLLQEGSETTFEDILGDEGHEDKTVDGMYAQGRGEAIDEWLGVLSERQRLVIRMRFGLDGGEPLTLEKIGIALGVTRERARQIEDQAKDKLRRHVPNSRLYQEFICEERL